MEYKDDIVRVETREIGKTLKEKDEEIAALRAQLQNQKDQPVVLKPGDLEKLLNNAKGADSGAYPIDQTKCLAIGETVPNVADAFEHVKGYRVRCTGRNVLLKYKAGVGMCHRP